MAAKEPRGAITPVNGSPRSLTPRTGLGILLGGMSIHHTTILLSLLFVHDRADVWIIYVVTFLYGASGYLFSSARSALLTQLLPVERLANANAAIQTVSEGSRLIAPLIGAALFAALGGAAVAVLDAATFAASAICLAAVRMHESRPQRSEHHILVQVAAGARHIAASIGPMITPFGPKLAIPPSVVTRTR